MTFQMHRLPNRFRLRASRYGALWRKWQKSRSLRDLNSLTPVLVLGTQKTGSTAIASLLSEATGRSVTLDIVRAIAHPEWKILLRYGIGDFEDYVVRYKREFSADIIKEPGLTYFYDELVRVFPRARFVMIQRNPFDTIRSILNRLQIPGDLPELNIDDWPLLKRSPAWRINLDTSWLGISSGNYVGALASRWNLAAQIYLNNRDAFQLIRYEDFLQDKVASISNLARSLGLVVVNDITPYLDRQFQKKGVKTTDYRSFFGGNYERIVDICSESATQFAYTLASPG